LGFAINKFNHLARPYPRIAKVGLARPPSRFQRSADLRVHDQGNPLRPDRHRTRKRQLPAGGPGQMNGYYFYVDPVGACNLRCPSCAVGNSPEVNNARGTLSPGLLRRILAKATAECEVEGVGLYNWAEPMLAPRLAELVATVHEFGLMCDLSTNLNRVRNLPALLRANPRSMRISLSGFSQAAYGITHRGGDIELVKANMRILSEVRAATGSTTAVEVCFHRYLSNRDDEDPMRELCKTLGFSFLPMWALWLPLEKVLAAAGETGYGALGAEDRRLLGNLALPLREALLAASSAPKSACHLQTRIVALDVAGRVQLCCGVYDASRFSIANYLDTPIEKIQALRLAHPTCETCQRHGVHDYFMYRIPGADEIAAANMAREAGRAGVVIPLRAAGQ